MNIEHDYLRLLKDVLDNGKEKEDRTGTGTISVFGRQIRHKMNQGFPLLTTKKMYWKGIVTELLWFLRGDTNIKYLVDNDCHIWDGDAYKKYKKEWSKSVPGDGSFKESEYNTSKPYESSNFTKEEFINKIKTDDEFAKKWGELGPIYGRMWRAFDEDSYGGIDQIQNSINLLKTDPDSRRNIVSAWHPGYNQHSVLPPCHNFFQFYTRELSLEEKEWQLEKTNCINDIENDRIIYGHEWKNYIQEQYESIQSTQGIKIPTRAISLMWNQRSVDTFLGLPFNIASYGLLLEIIAKEVNMVPDELIGNLGDVHLYKNHIEQAKEQLTREPKRLPKVLINNGEVDNNGVPFTKSVLDGYDIIDFELVDYQSHTPIKAPLSN